MAYDALSFWDMKFYVARGRKKTIFELNWIRVEEK